MIQINFTGLDRFHWWPSIERRSNKRRLWYITFRFLDFSVTFLSIEMATEYTKRFNESCHLKEELES